VFRTDKTFSHSFREFNSMLTKPLILLGGSDRVVNGVIDQLAVEAKPAWAAREGTDAVSEPVAGTVSTPTHSK
jgi:hypothetical protein